MKNQSLARNAILNGIRTLCSIIFPFITFSYCSRVLGSNKIGAFSFSQSIISYLLLIAGLGISNYAIREGCSKKDNKEELAVFINEVFTINVLSTILSYLILLILIIFVSKINAYKTIILIQSIHVLMTTLGTDWINTIYEDYIYITIRYIIIQIISLIFLLLFVKTSNDLYIYTIISVFANSAGYALNWIYLRKKGIRVFLTSKVHIKNHIKPIIILFTNSIASVIYLNSDITMLGFLTDDTQVGIYSISTKIYSMLKTLINAVILVTLPRFSNLIAKNQINEYKNSLKSINEVLLIMILPIMTLLFFESEKILYIVAGSKYLSGLNVVRILGLSILFAVYACFFSYSILIPNKKEKYFMFSTILAAFVNIILNFILIPIFGIEAAALTTLIAEIIVFFITMIYSKKIICLSLDISVFIKSIIGCFFIGLICVFFDNIFLNSSIILSLIEFVLCFVIYLIVLFVTKCNTLKMFFNNIVKKV